ncbi:MAG: hypothetical protein ABL958_09240 [Bdellovibrionia bacterium]
MKNLIVLLTLLVGLPAVSHAALKYSPEAPAESYVKGIKTRLEPSLFKIKGVNGVGITACETKTGTPFVSIARERLARLLFEPCVSIHTETTAALVEVRSHLPQAKRYRGVYVVSDKIGKIEAQ